MIAGQQHDAPNTHSREIAKDVGDSRPERVRVLDDTGDLTIDRDVRAKTGILRLEYAEPRFVDRRLVEHERPRPYDDAVAVDRARDAPPGRLDDTDCRWQR
jgi:hypothetical protein